MAPLTGPSVSCGRCRPRFGGGDDWLKGGALKVFADGGILTGTAFMRQPWGAAAAALYGLARPTKTEGS